MLHVQHSLQKKKEKKEAHLHLRGSYKMCLSNSLDCAEGKSSEMTAVTVVSITLLTWMVSPGTWLKPHQHPDFTEYEHMEKIQNFSSEMLTHNR